MVTASHNPTEYHGFKVFDATGGSLSYDKGLKDVEALVAGHRRPGVASRRTSFPEIDGLGRLRAVRRRGRRGEAAVVARS